MTDFQNNKYTVVLFSFLLIAGKQLYQFGGTLEKKLPRIDDSPSTEVNLDVKFPFYGEMEKVLYVRGYDCYGR